MTISNSQLICDKVIGKIKFVGNDDFHIYEFVESGVRQASVTTKNILEKPFLYDYSAKKAFEYLEAEGFSTITPSNRNIHLANAIDARKVILRDSSDNVGTPAHDVIERYLDDWIKFGKIPKDITNYINKVFIFDETLKKDIEVTDPRIYASVLSAENWCQRMDKRINPLFAEIIVGDERYSAGKIDFIFEWKDTKELVVVDWKTSNAVYDDMALQATAYAKFLEHMIGRKATAMIAHLSKERDSYEIYKVKDMAKNYVAFKSMCKLYDWKNNGRKKLAKDITIYDTTGEKNTKSVRIC